MWEVNAKHWLFFMMETLPHDQFTRMCVTLWVIWSSRRKAIHEEIFQSPISTNGFINTYLEEPRVYQSLRELLYLNVKLLDLGQSGSHHQRIWRRSTWMQRCPGQKVLGLQRLFAVIVTVLTREPRQLSSMASLTLQ
jgi:hypothetical protein